MTDTPFVHLHVHTAYSLSAGALRIPQLIKWAQQNAMPAIAMTDTNNMFGALDFSLAVRDAGIQPIIGAELGLRRTDGQLSSIGGGGQHHLDPDRIVLLVQNEQGHLNLMDLLSRSYLNIEPHENPQIGLSDLADCSDGLICLTGGAKGVIGRLSADGQVDLAKSKTEHLKDIFADRLYMEIGRHGESAEIKSESTLIDLAYAFDIPLVATNNCYYLDKGMAESHDALMCIASGELMEQDGRDKLTPEYYLKTAEEMTELFSDLPEAIINTAVVAQRCHYITQTIDPLLPEYPYLEGRTEAQALRDLSETGLEKRLADNVYTDDMDDVKKAELKKQYFDRLDFELQTIVDMGFPGYFLIVADFIQWGKEKNIPIGPGRGSGAGSVVAWALTITDLDPLRWGLLFERFLNPERVSMPDFDIDFCQERREEVIKYVQEQYGRDKVAQIITFGKLQARAVVRDVGRVLAMPYPQVDRIGKLIPSNPANPTTLAQALETETLLQKERDDDPTAQKMLDMALKLEGLYRHASTHAAGVVIGDRPLNQLVPLYRDPKSDMPVTQFNLKFVEKAGLVKFDFLGLATLTIMDKARQMIENRPEVEQGSIDFSLLPLDDSTTYDMIARAETAGVFQLESSGMRQVIKGMKPDRFEDLIALVSLYRPGPMEYIPTYNACKHGEQAPQYLHPVLKPILEETFGIAVYQEQVMQMAQKLAGYTLGGADLLRRAMGKKDPVEMAKQRQIFSDGAKQHNDVDQKLADEIFNDIEAFAGYGFNKSHAAAYALIAYHTAWLKAHYPVEFMAATMILALNNTDKLGGYKDELNRMGIPLLLPDVNHSEVLFSCQSCENGVEAVRYALGAVKGVGEDAMGYVIKARDEGGPFKDIFDFVERVDSKALNKRIMENLTHAGAFDGLWDNRRQIVENIDSILRYGQSVQSERNSDQVSLFGEDVSTNNRPKLPDVHDWQDNQKLTYELTAIGFYLSAHPLENYQNICDRLDIKKWADVEGGRVRLHGNSPVRVAGIVTDMRVINTKNGKKVCFLSLSDTSAPFEITLFEETLNQNWDLLKSSQPIVAHVKVEKIKFKKDGEGASVDKEGEDRLRVTALSLSGLEDEAAKTAKGIRISLSDDKPMAEIANAFTTHAQENERGGLVKIILHSPNGEIELSLPNRQKFTSDLLIALKNIPGIMKLEEL